MSLSGIWIKPDIIRLSEIARCREKNMFCRKNDANVKGQLILEGVEQWEEEGQKEEDGCEHDQSTL
jgi:hypothetical protein